MQAIPRISSSSARMWSDWTRAMLRGSWCGVMHGFIPCHKCESVRGEAGWLSTNLHGRSKSAPNSTGPLSNLFSLHSTLYRIERRALYHLSLSPIRYSTIPSVYDAAAAVRSHWSLREQCVRGPPPPYRALPSVKYRCPYKSPPAGVSTQHGPTTASGA